MPLTLVRQAENGNTGNQTTITVALGATAAAGNLLVAAICSDKSSGAYTRPSGFTALYTYDSANVSGCVAYKIAVGTETQTVWSQVTTSANGLSAWMAEYRGNIATPSDVALGANSGTTAVKTLSVGPTNATAQADELALAFCGSDSWSLTNGGRSWNNSFAEIADVGSGSGPPGLTIAAKALTAKGAVTVAYTTTGTGDQLWIAVCTFIAGVPRLALYQARMRG